MMPPPSLEELKPTLHGSDFHANAQIYPSALLPLAMRRDLVRSKGYIHYLVA